jgi:hypothetical protein
LKSLKEFEENEIEKEIVKVREEICKNIQELMRMPDINIGTNSILNT